jgi:hypothetical protein
MTEVRIEGARAPRRHVWTALLILSHSLVGACFLVTNEDDLEAPDAGSSLDASRNQGPKWSGPDGSDDDDAGALPEAGAEADGGPTPEPDAGADDGGADDASAHLADGGETYPVLLSQTGLYRDIENDVTASDVRFFQPRFALWSDGADKRRWLRLPPTARVDTSDMDGWIFPVGTKAWKEFRAQGVRIETRMLHKVSSDRWTMISYRWLPDQSDAEALPEGASDALGTNHDIPSEDLCVRCHGNTPDALLGFSAIQLSHDLGGENLTRLARAQLLSDPPASDFRIPGGVEAEQALGYLHANCGHCHLPGSPAYLQILRRPPMTGGPILWERTDALESAESAWGYASTVGKANAVLPDLHIIEPGRPEASELFIRISQRGRGSLQMPPIGTELVDEKGLATIRDWIESLAPSR